MSVIAASEQQGFEDLIQEVSWLINLVSFFFPFHLLYFITSEN